MGTAAVVPQIPMVAPDGTPGMADASAVPSLSKSGYKAGMVMHAPDGTKGIAAFEDVKDLMSKGYKNQAQYENAQQVKASDPNAAGIINTPLRLLSSAGGAIVDAGKGIYHTLTDPATSPEEMGVEAAQGKPGLLAYRAVIAPQIDQAKKAIQGAQSPDMQTRIQSGAHALAALTPMAGPAAAQVGDAMRSQFEDGNIAGGIGTLAGNVVLAALMGKAGKAMLPESTVPGQNYTPSHGAAFEGLTAKATGMGPNFTPQSLTSDALSPIRQSASDMLANGTPVEQSIARNATAKGIAPLDRLGAIHSIIQKSLSDLEDQHTPALAQVAQTPVDMTSIQQGLKSQIKPGMSSADIAGINDLIQRSGQITNIGELNNFRQIMNEEASPSYRQTPTRAGQASAPQQVATDAANAVRSHYYDQLQQATGTDFQPLKAQQSKLLQTKEAIERLQAPESKAEAAFHAGAKSPKEIAGDLANIIKDPRTTVTQTLLRESPATRTANLIRKSLADLPDPTAQATPAISSGTLATLPASVQRILALTRGNQ